jgi:hypothetical protein
MLLHDCKWATEITELQLVWHSENKLCCAVLCRSYLFITDRLRCPILLPLHQSTCSHNYTLIWCVISLPLSYPVTSNHPNHHYSHLSTIRGRCLPNYKHGQWINVVVQPRSQSFVINVKGYSSKETEKNGYNIWVYFQELTNNCKSANNICISTEKHNYCDDELVERNQI